MRGRVGTRLAASLALVILLVGSVVGLAVVRGDIRLGPKRASLVLKKSKELALPVRDLAPGDRVERLMILQNRGRTPLRRLRFEIGEQRRSGVRLSKVRVNGRLRTVCRSARTKRRVSCKRKPSRSALATARREGLRVSVQRCPVPWKRLRAKAPAYVCPKKMVAVVGWTRIPVRRVLRKTPPLRPGERAHLRVTLLFPRRATNALQNTTAVLVPRFTARGGLR